mgnify:FL=1
MREKFLESIEVKNQIVASDQLDNLKLIGDQVTDTILSGGKLMICGNGGSAADAQHLVAELLVRLRPAINRKGVPALTLAQDTSTITACANDYSYDFIFERVLDTMGCKGDSLLSITTSGNSNNIYNAMIKGKEMKIKLFGFLGGDGGKVKDLCDNYFLVPSKNTARIQESHITAGHVLMEYIEDRLIENEYLEVDKIK